MSPLPAAAHLTLTPTTVTDKSMGGGKALFMLIHKEMLERMHLHDFASQVL